MNRRDALKKSVYGIGLAGATPMFLGLLQACAKQERESWTPKFLNKPQVDFITSFVDFLLPRTDTPGGLDVNADIFIDLIYAKVLDEKTQQLVAEEIERFNQKCLDDFGSEFAKLSKEDKATCFRDHEASSPKFAPRVWGSAVGEQQPVGFYRELKTLALNAYFNSEEIGKNHLSYDPIPGEYRGCIDLDEVGKSWSF
jgi:hypothetical protein